MNLGQILNESLDIVLEDALNKVLERAIQLGPERALWKSLEGTFLKGLEGSLEVFEKDLGGSLEAASEESREDSLGEAASQRGWKCCFPTSQGMEQGSCFEWTWEEQGD